MAKDAPMSALNQALASVEDNGTMATYSNLMKPLDIMDADLKRNFNILSPEWAHLEIPPSTPDLK
jgi:hypothetical protein